MKHLYKLLLIILFASCNNAVKEHSKSEALYKIDIDVSEPKKLSAEIIKSSEYIVLETSNSSIIGEIENLFVTDSLLIIFDTKQMEILIFDNKGKYLRKVGTKGAGPNEYIYLNDVFVDETNEFIYAHERYLNKIFKYNFAGELLNVSEKSKYSFNYFFKVPEGYWVYSCFNGNTNPEGYNLMLLDESLQNVKASFFPQKEFFNVEFFSPRFCKDEQGNNYFYYPTSNIIYHLSGNDAKPYIEVDFGERTMPYAKIANMTDDKEYESLINDNSYLGSIRDLQINNGKVYFTFKESGTGKVVQSYRCLYSINNSNMLLYNNPFIDYYKYPISAEVVRIVNNKLYFLFHPSMVSANSFAILEKEFSSPINAESNPIICVMEIDI